MMRLADAMPVAVSRLSLQYRMHKDICDLCNDIVYKGTLKCANDQVSTALLTLDNFPNGLPKLQKRIFTSNSQSSLSATKSDDQDWLLRIIDPRYVVVFADTDRIHSDPSIAEGQYNCQLKAINCKNVSVNRYLETSSPKGSGRMRGRSGVTNFMEVELIRRTATAFVSCGLDVSDIGVISPFRSQVITSNCFYA